MRKSRCFVVVLTLLACGIAPAADEAPAEKPSPLKFVISKETTRITEPLKADGTPDYAAWLNKKYGEGVTPENNFMTAAVEVFGRESLAPAIADKLIEKLGAKEVGEAKFKRGDFGNNKKLAEQAWKAEDHPEVVEWLEANKAGLDTLAEASRRPHYFLPIIYARSDDTLMDHSLFSPSLLRYAGQALLIRANLARGEKRFDEARADFAACRRIGIRVRQGFTVLERLSGKSLIVGANKATADWASQSNWTEAEARKILSDLVDAEPNRRIAESVDQFERFSRLEIIVQGTINGFQSYQSIRKGVRQAEQAGDGKLDWSRVLRLVNDRFDQQVQAMRDSTYEKWMAASKAEAQAVGALAEHTDPRFEDDVSVAVANMLIQWLYPSLSRSTLIEERCRSEHQIAVLTVALAGYHVKHGEYPRSLDALSPGFLKAVPTDFFADGKPFEYKRTEKGYELSSAEPAEW